MRIIDRPDLNGKISDGDLWLLPLLMGSGWMESEDPPHPVDIEIPLVRVQNRLKSLKRRVKEANPDCTLSHAQPIGKGVFRRWL